MPLQQFALGSKEPQAAGEAGVRWVLDEPLNALEAQGWNLQPEVMVAALGVFAGVSLAIIIGLNVWLSGDAASLFRLRSKWNDVEVEPGRIFGECPELNEPDLDPPAPDFAALASR